MELTGEDLFSEYGNCIIPQGTLLYRGFNSVDIQVPCMFFTTKFEFASHVPGGLTQVWKMQRDVRVIFMIDYLDRYARAISSIEKIYGGLFPDEAGKHNDLQIKQRDSSTRSKFIDKLSKLGIAGWFSSLENNQEVEVCLFYPSSDDVKLIVEVDPKSEMYCIDSLRDLKLYPSQRFTNRTQELLRRQHGTFSLEEAWQSYKRYHESMIQEVISIEQNNELKINEAFYNLRMKLHM